LKQSNLELEDQVSRQEKELRNASSEINKLHSALFNSKSEADLLRAKVTILIKNLSVLLKFSTM
jgi:hypothetical protein